MFKRGLQEFLKKTTTKAGVVIALLFQMIFSIIWMTGYDGVTDNTKELRIAVVNDDQTLGTAIAERLKTQLPFQLTEESSLDRAKEQLDEREYHMVVHIPADFAGQAQNPNQTAHLTYYINESNPAMIKNVMQNVASTITGMVNQEAASAGIEAAAGKAGVPKEQAEALAVHLPQRVESQFEMSNQIEGMNNQMVPMMLVLASYVGSMIMTMNLQLSSRALGPAVSKWRKFGIRILVISVTALIISLFGSSLVQLLGGQAVQGFMAIWAFQALFLISFLLMSEFFLVLFGNAGMIFNIIVLSAQLVSSGAMVPRELLSGFYQGLGDVLPATYAVEGMMNLLFGGSGTAGAVGGLSVIIAILLILVVAAVAVRKERASNSATAGGAAA